MQNIEPCSPQILKRQAPEIQLDVFVPGQALKMAIPDLIWCSNQSLPLLKGPFPMRKNQYFNALHRDNTRHLEIIISFGGFSLNCINNESSCLKLLLAIGTKS